MSIKSFSEMQNTFRTYETKNWAKSVDLEKSFNVAEEEGEIKSQSFGDFLAKSIGQVNELQKDANVAMEKIASGESKNIHETLLAVERADMAFRTMNQVRQKVLDAYKEIMRMQM